MTQTLTEPLGVFQKVFDGELITGDHPAYDSVRALWNTEIDRHPAVIARCTKPTDVASAVTFGREQGLEIAVRCGSHNAAGTASCDGGLMIDLSLMRSVSVDPRSRRVRVAGGALLGDMDAATQAHGLATTAGTVSHTGVGGLTLGGGFGWLAHRHGLAVDNLLSAEVVTADGRIRRASEQENPDLFWALRGGGGNFGVVTEFEFRLHEVGPVIDFGLLFYPLEQGVETLRVGREVAAAASRDVTVFTVALNAPPAEFVPEEHRFRPGYAVLLAGFGDDDEHARLCAQVRTGATPLVEHVDRIPYLALQQMLDEANAWGLYNYEKAIYLDGLTDEVIAVAVEQVASKTSPLSYVLFQPTGGAYADLGPDDTAFGGPRTGYGVYAIGLTRTREELPAEREWIRSLWQALLPHARGIGSYVNAMVELEPDRIRASYGPAKYSRLAEIKHRYDPDNLFHLNANIPPSLSPGQTEGP
jgi:FAD/FMN-containing dehydrogenase